MSPVATGWSDKTCMTGCDATPATAWPLCRTEAPSLSDAIRWLFDCRRSCARTVDFVSLHSSPFVGPTLVRVFPLPATPRFAFSWSFFGRGSLGCVVRLLRAKSLRPDGVTGGCPTAVRVSEVRPTEVRVPEVRPTEVRPTEVRVPE